MGKTNRNGQRRRRGSDPTLQSAKDSDARARASLDVAKQKARDAQDDARHTSKTFMTLLSIIAASMGKTVLQLWATTPALSKLCYHHHTHGCVKDPCNFSHAELPDPTTLGLSSPKNNPKPPDPVSIPPPPGSQPPASSPTPVVVLPQLPRPAPSHNGASAAAVPPQPRRNAWGLTGPSALPTTDEKRDNDYPPLRPAPVTVENASTVAGDLHTTAPIASVVTGTPQTYEQLRTAAKAALTRAFEVAVPQKHPVLASERDTLRTAMVARVQADVLRQNYKISDRNRVIELGPGRRVMHPQWHANLHPFVPADIERQKDMDATTLVSRCACKPTACNHVTPITYVASHVYLSPDQLFEYTNRTAMKRMYVLVHTFPDAHGFLGEGEYRKFADGTIAMTINGHASYTTHNPDYMSGGYVRCKHGALSIRPMPGGEGETSTVWIVDVVPIDVIADRSSVVGTPSHPIRLNVAMLKAQAGTVDVSRAEPGSDESGNPVMRNYKAYVVPTSNTPGSTHGLLVDDGSGTVCLPLDLVDKAAARFAGEVRDRTTPPGRELYKSVTAYVRRNAKSYNVGPIVAALCVHVPAIAARLYRDTEAEVLSGVNALSWSDWFERQRIDVHNRAVTAVYWTWSWAIIRLCLIVIIIAIASAVTAGGCVGVYRYLSGPAPPGAEVTPNAPILARPPIAPIVPLGIDARLTRATYPVERVNNQTSTLMPPLTKYRPEVYQSTDETEYYGLLNRLLSQQPKVEALDQLRVLSAFSAISAGLPPNAIHDKPVTLQEWFKKAAYPLPLQKRMLDAIAEAQQGWTMRDFIRTQASDKIEKNKIADPQALPEGVTRVIVASSPLLNGVLGPVQATFKKLYLAVYGVGQHEFLTYVPGSSAVDLARSVHKELGECTLIEIDCSKFDSTINKAYYIGEMGMYAWVGMATFQTPIGATALELYEAMATTKGRGRNDNRYLCKYRRASGRVNTTDGNTAATHAAQVKSIAQVYGHSAHTLMNVSATGPTLVVGLIGTGKTHSINTGRWKVLDADTLWVQGGGKHPHDFNNTQEYLEYYDFLVAHMLKHNVSVAAGFTPAALDRLVRTGRHLAIRWSWYLPTLANHTTYAEKRKYDVPLYRTGYLAAMYAVYKAYSKRAWTFEEYIGNPPPRIRFHGFGAGDDQALGIAGADQNDTRAIVSAMADTGLRPKAKYPIDVYTLTLISALPYPCTINGAPDFCFGPMPGRIFLRIPHFVQVYVKNDKVRLAYIRGTALGLWPVCSHIPFLRVYLKHILDLTRDVTPLYHKRDEPHKLRNVIDVSQLHQNVGLPQTDARTWDFFITRYGLNPYDEELFAESLATLHTLDPAIYNVKSKSVVSAYSMPYVNHMVGIDVEMVNGGYPCAASGGGPWGMHVMHFLQHGDQRHRDICTFIRASTAHRPDTQQYVELEERLKRKSPQGMSHLIRAELNAIRHTPTYLGFNHFDEYVNRVALHHMLRDANYEQAVAHHVAYNVAVVSGRPPPPNPHFDALMPAYVASVLESHWMEYIEKLGQPDPGWIMGHLSTPSKYRAQYDHILKSREAQAKGDSRPRVADVESQTHKEPAKSDSILNRALETLDSAFDTTLLKLVDTFEFFNTTVRSIPNDLYDNMSNRTRRARQNRAAPPVAAALLDASSKLAEAKRDIAAVATAARERPSRAKRRQSRAARFGSKSAGGTKPAAQQSVVVSNAPRPARTETRTTINHATAIGFPGPVDATKQMTHSANRTRVIAQTADTTTVEYVGDFQGLSLLTDSTGSYIFNGTGNAVLLNPKSLGTAIGVPASEYRMSRIEELDLWVVPETGTSSSLTAGTILLAIETDAAYPVIAGVTFNKDLISSYKDKLVTPVYQTGSPPILKYVEKRRRWWYNYASAQTISSAPVIAEERDCYQLSLLGVADAAAVSATLGILQMRVRITFAGQKLPVTLPRARLREAAELHMYRVATMAAKYNRAATAKGRPPVNYPTPLLYQSLRLERYSLEISGEIVDYRRMKFLSAYIDTHDRIINSMVAAMEAVELKYTPRFPETGTSFNATPVVIVDSRVTTDANITALDALGSAVRVENNSLSGTSDVNVAKVGGTAVDPNAANRGAFTVCITGDPTVSQSVGAQTGTGVKPSTTDANYATVTNGALGTTQWGSNNPPVRVDIAAAYGVLGAAVPVDLAAVAAVPVLSNASNSFIPAGTVPVNIGGYDNGDGSPNTGVYNVMQVFGGGNPPDTPDIKDVMAAIATAKAEFKGTPRQQAFVKWAKLNAKFDNESDQKECANRYAYYSSRIWPTLGVNAMVIDSKDASSPPADVNYAPATGVASTNKAMGYDPTISIDANNIKTWDDPAWVPGTERNTADVSTNVTTNAGSRSKSLPPVSAKMTPPKTFLTKTK